MYNYLHRLFLIFYSMSFKKNFQSLKQTFGAMVIATASAVQAQSTGVVQPGVQQDVNNSLSALAPLLRTDKDIGNVRVGV